MRCHLLVEDQLHFWTEDSMVRRCCTQQHDISMFDPDSGTACCEAALSHWLVPVYGTFCLREEESQDNDELLERLDERVRDSLRDDGSYMHCSRVKSLPHYKDTADLPSPLPATFVLEWHEDGDAEELEDFREDIQGNPPL